MSQDTSKQPLVSCAKIFCRLLTIDRRFQSYSMYKHVFGPSRGLLKSNQGIFPTQKIVNRKRKKKMPENRLRHHEFPSFCNQTLVFCQGYTLLVSVAGPAVTPSSGDPITNATNNKNVSVFDMI